MRSSTGTMYVIDAMALIYQMFHAIRDQMSAPDGRPTNAVFGVTRDLIYLNDDVQPDYLVVAFDRPEPTFREAFYGDYKKNRPEPPSDLVIQIPMIEEVVRAMNLPCLSVESFEADDIMATLAVEGSARGLDVFLCTTDKDCRQVISDHVCCYNLRKRLKMDAAWLMEEWGVKPEQVVDFQSMVGDSVDNVPGVPGIGEKTAAKLLQQYGSLEKIIENVNQITGAKMKANLQQSITSGDLERARKLVRLSTDVPLPYDWEGWKRREWNNAKLLELFTQFGFRRFSDRVRSAAKTATGLSSNAEFLAAMGMDTPETMPKKKPSEGLFDELSDADDFAFGANAAPEEWLADYQLLDSEESWQSFYQLLLQQKFFALDILTASPDPLQSEWVGMAFTWQAGLAYFLPWRSTGKYAWFNEEKVLQQLKPIFADASIKKTNHNIKFDWLCLHAKGLELNGIAGDAMLAHYLEHASERTHQLEDMTRAYYQHEKKSLADSLGKGKTQKRVEELMPETLCAFAGEEVDAAWRLADRLESQFEPTIRQLYDEVEIPLLEVLADVEATGIRIDLPFLKQLSATMDGQLAEIEGKIHAAAGREFNIASPLQLREVLFDQFKMPVQKRTGQTNEPSTDQETLERLAKIEHEKSFIAAYIVEHRQVSKLKGTYVDALPELVHPKTGRVHTSFNQTVAATGRLSSSNPNLQNVPMRTEQGRQIRQAFLPKAGWKLLTADYSQIELRLLAHFSGDEAMLQAFREEKDVHASVAAQIFHVPEAEVTPAQRRVAKTVNFGVIYGMSAFGLAERLDLKRGEAEKFIKAYFDRFPKVLGYQDQLLANARRDGLVRTILGRKRLFDPRSIRPYSSYKNRNQAEREAINMEIQGSAADLMKLAMLAIHRRLKKEQLKAKMLLTVHDELVLEVPPKELSTVSELVKHEMNRALTLNVPLSVDIGHGENWLEIE